MVIQRHYGNSSRFYFLVTLVLFYVLINIQKIKKNMQITKNHKKSFS